MMSLPKEWSQASVSVRRALPRKGHRVQTPAVCTFCAGAGCGSAESSRGGHTARNALRATRTLSHVTQGRGEEQAIEERVFEREIKAAAPEQDDFLGGDGHGGQPRLLAQAPLAGDCPLAAQSSARLQHPPQEERTTARAPHRAPRPSNVLSAKDPRFFFLSKLSKFDVCASTKPSPSRVTPDSACGARSSACGRWRCWWWQSLRRAHRRDRRRRNHRPRDLILLSRRSLRRSATAPTCQGGCWPTAAARGRLRPCAWAGDLARS